MISESLTALIRANVASQAYRSSLPSATPFPPHPPPREFLFAPTPRPRVLASRPYRDLAISFPFRGERSSLCHGDVTRLRFASSWVATCRLTISTTLFSFSFLFFRLSYPELLPAFNVRCLFNFGLVWFSSSPF